MSKIELSHSKLIETLCKELPEEVIEDAVWKTEQFFKKVLFEEVVKKLEIEVFERTKLPSFLFYTKTNTTLAISFSSEEYLYDMRDTQYAYEKFLKDKEIILARVKEIEESFPSLNERRKEIETKVRKQLEEKWKGAESYQNLMNYDTTLRIEKLNKSGIYFTYATTHYVKEKEKEVWSYETGVHLTLKQEKDGLFIAGYEGHEVESTEKMNFQEWIGEKEFERYSLTEDKIEKVFYEYTNQTIENHQRLLENVTFI